MAAPQDSAHAVADVYAKALLETANERGQTDEIAAQFADLLAYMDREPDFTEFMTSLMVGDDDRRMSLDRLFGGKMNDLLLNALQVLNKRNRADLVRAVYERFCDQLRTQRHQVEVAVRTAVPLSDDVRETVRKFLSEQLGCEAILVPSVDPSLLGGLIIQVGDRRVDASLSRRVQKLRKRLVERASVEVRSGRKYFDGTDSER